MLDVIIPLYATGFICAAAGPAASTWYLSPSGSDSAGVGSREKPWRTIRFATGNVPDDGSTIILLDGLYEGAESISRRFTKPCLVRAENPCRARLRSPADGNRALTCYDAANVTFQGLEIFGSGSTKGEYLIHISTPKTRHLLFDGCMIHDGYNNDLIKINDFTRDIRFRGCIFFNQTDHGGDEHFDINTVTDIAVEDSIFFNDYAGSGRRAQNQSHAFVVIKNSGSTPEVTRRIAFRRNIFLNWQGLGDEAYLLLGEDGKPFIEAQQVTIENNLFIHNSPAKMWGALLLKGGLRDITFRANTIVGHPQVKGSGAFAAVCLRIDQNPPMGDLAFVNNLFSDPTGQMPRFTMSNPQHFAGKPVIQNNLYWNAGKAIPHQAGDLLVPDQDPARCIADPRLPKFDPAITLPRFDPVKGEFPSGERTIRKEFERLVARYAALGEGSPAIHKADPGNMPEDDILGHPRGARPDIGCFEHELSLSISPSSSAASMALRGPTGDPARLARIRGAKMPPVAHPVLFNTPEADAILAALEVFPADNPWNQLVTDWPVHPNSKAMVASVGEDKPLRYNADMGFVLVPPEQKRVEVKIVGYPGESDPGPFPVPDNTPIEGWPVAYRGDVKWRSLSLDDVQRNKLHEDADRHAIVVDPANRILYEFYHARKTATGWEAAQASTFDLKSNVVRPTGWTSSDAAGLPIFPAVVRYDELKRGVVDHALRVTVRRSRREFVAPATHYASPHTDPSLPRMGERFRLPQNFDVSGFSPEVRVILTALKRYGMFVADNGIEWAISVAPDERIPPLHEELRRVKGADFEVVTPPR
jgi:hypothetical protein